MIRETFAVPGPAELDISLTSGSLTVDSGPHGQVEVAIDTPSPDAWEVNQSGDTISVWHGRDFLSRGSRARIQVKVPPGSSLKAATASADVRVNVELDRISVNSASGDVKLAGFDTAAVKTASGDVLAGPVARDLTVRSASGDVRGSTVGGSAAITTASGDISFDEVSGALSVSTASGDLRLGLYTGEDIEANTMSGDVDIGLPPGRQVKLEAKTLSGRVRLPERRPTSGDATTSISVRLKSVSGDVTIRRVE